MLPSMHEYSITSTLGVRTKILSLLMGRVYERKGDFERATNALKAALFA